MRRSLGVVAAILAELPPLQVGEIRRGEKPPPRGLVRIHAIRGSTVRVTEPVDAATVEWSRLAPDHRVELLDAPELQGPPQHPELDQRTFDGLIDEGRKLSAEMRRDGAGMRRFTPAEMAVRVRAAKETP